MQIRRKHFNKIETGQVRLSNLSTRKKIVCLTLITFWGKKKRNCDIFIKSLYSRDCVIQHKFLLIRANKKTFLHNKQFYRKHISWLSLTLNLLNFLKRNNPTSIFQNLALSIFILEISRWDCTDVQASLALYTGGKG